MAVSGVFDGSLAVLSSSFSLLFWKFKGAITYSAIVLYFFSLKMEMGSSTEDIMKMATITAITLILDKR